MDRISHLEIMDLPIRRYEGPVSLVTSAETLREALADIRREAVVGLDTETRPAFRKGESYPPSLVQMATARKVYLFRLSTLDFSSALAEILEDKATVKVGVALAGDLRQLEQLFPFTAESVIDLGHVARRRGLHQTGLRNLAGLFLGFRIPKGARTSNWAAPRLSDSQIRYAATDAWVCRELYLRFFDLGLLEARGRPESGPSQNPTSSA